MLRILTLCLLMGLIACLAQAQTVTETRTICKGTAIPEGFEIVGETDSKQCKQQAWIVRNKSNASTDNSSNGKKMTPKFAPGGESGSYSDTDKESHKQWQSLYEWQLFVSPAKDFSVMAPGKPSKKSSMEDGSQFDNYLVIANRVVYLFSSAVATTPAPGGAPKELDLFMKDFVDMLKEHGIGGDLFFDRRVDTNGFFGKQFKTISTLVPSIMRYYIKGKRLYFIAIIGADDKDENANKVLSSFKITK